MSELRHQSWIKIWVKAILIESLADDTNYNIFLPEVVDGYFRVLADDFVLFVDVGGGEVDHDIHDKHDVNCNRKIKWFQVLSEEVLMLGSVLWFFRKPIRISNKLASFEKFSNFYLKLRYICIQSPKRSMMTIGSEP